MSQQTIEQFIASENLEIKILLRSQETSLISDVRNKAWRISNRAGFNFDGEQRHNIIIFPAYAYKGDKSPEPYFFIGELIQGEINIHLAFELMEDDHGLSDYNHFSREEKLVLLDMISEDTDYFPIHEFIHNTFE